MVPWICAYCVLLPVVLLDIVLSQPRDVKDEGPEIYMITLGQRKFILMPIGGEVSASQETGNKNMMGTKSEDSINPGSHQNTLKRLTRDDANLLLAKVKQQKLGYFDDNRQLPMIVPFPILKDENLDFGQDNQNLKDMVRFMKVLDNSLSENFDKNEKKCISKGKHVALQVPCSILKHQNTNVFKNNRNGRHKLSISNKSKNQGDDRLSSQNSNSHTNNAGKSPRTSPNRPLNLQGNNGMNSGQPGSGRSRYVNPNRNVNVGFNPHRRLPPNTSANGKRVRNVKNVRGNVVPQNNPPRGPRDQPNNNNKQRVIDNAHAFRDDMIEKLQEVSHSIDLPEDGNKQRVPAGGNSMLLPDGLSVDIPTLLRKIYTHSIQLSQNSHGTPSENGYNQEVSSSIQSAESPIDESTLLREIYMQSMNPSNNYQQEISNPSGNADKQTLNTNPNFTPQSEVSGPKDQSENADEIVNLPENTDKVTGNTLLLPDGSSIDMNSILQLINNYVTKNVQNVGGIFVPVNSMIASAKSSESTLVPVVIPNHLSSSNHNPLIYDQQFDAADANQSGDSQPNIQYFNSLASSAKKVKGLKKIIPVPKKDTINEELTKHKCDPNLQVEALMKKLSEAVAGKTVTVNLGLNTNLAELLLLTISKISADSSFANVVSNIDKVMKTGNSTSTQELDLKLEFTINSGKFDGSEQTRASPVVNGTSPPAAVNHTNPAWSKSGPADHEVLNGLIFKPGVDELPSRDHVGSQSLNKEVSSRSDDSLKSRNISNSDIAPAEVASGKAGDSAPTTSATDKSTSPTPGENSTSPSPDLEIGNRIISYEDDSKPDSILNLNDTKKFFQSKTP